MTRIHKAWFIWRRHQHRITRCLQLSAVLTITFAIALALWMLVSAEIEEHEANREAALQSQIASLKVDQQHFVDFLNGKLVDRHVFADGNEVVVSAQAEFDQHE